jgi:hypothetical protein
METPIIYTNGCASCGIMGHYVRRVQRDFPTAVVKNSRYDKQARAEHAEYLTQAGLDKDRYIPIVVEGSNVTELAKWKPSN